MKQLYCTLFFFGFSLGLFAQQSSCSMEKENLKWSTDPSLIKESQTIENNILNAYYTSHTLPSKDSLIIIPIVVHIIHKGEQYGVGSNLSDSQVYDAVKGINHRFIGQYGFGVDTRIQFCLAKRDPNNQYTNGINRIDGTVVANYEKHGINYFVNDPGADEKAIKDLSKWPVSDYYNLWIVWNIYGPTGYANYPGTTINAYDGSVITAAGFNYNNSISTHEIGHGFNLRHTWDAIYSSCQNDTLCDTRGDRVCDTPPHVDLGKGDCNTLYPCKSKFPWDNTRKNIMGKCGAQNRFTQGQKERMRASLTATVRNSLLSSKGCIRVHKNDAELIKTLFCDSFNYVVIKNNGANTITSLTINWSVNGKPVQNIGWNGKLESLQLDTFLFAKNLVSNLQSVDLKVWSSAPNAITDTINHNDTLNLKNLWMPFTAGTYTVGGVNPDFKDLKDATSALNTRGVCGPVTLNIHKGTYAGNIEIKNVPGASSENTITFQSATLDAQTVKIEFATTTLNNYVVKLNSSKYIRFHHLTFNTTGGMYFSNVIVLENGAEHNQFDHCVFNGNSNTWSSGFATAIVYSPHTIDNFNSFTHNTFNKGSHGIYMRGNTTQEQGNNIIHNSFNNQTYNAIYVTNQNATTIKHNTIHARANAMYGIYIDASSKSLNIAHNKVLGNWKNAIYIKGYVSSDQYRGRIVNNTLHAEHSNNDAVIYLRDCEYLGIYHNNFSQHNTDAKSKSIHLYRSFNINLKNNNLANLGSGFTLYFDNTDLSSIQSDYNNLYTQGNQLVYDNGTPLNLTSWQNTGNDVHSISTNPMYKSDTVLYACATDLKGSGTYLPEVTIDMDSVNRSETHADIGAYELGEKLNIGADTMACDSVVIRGNIASGKYVWSNSDTAGQTTFYQSGTYWAAHTDECQAQTDTIVVTILTRPTAVLTDGNACDSFTLNAGNKGSTYLWSTKDTSQQLSVFKSGLYTVTINNNCGSTMDSAQVSINTKPVIKLGNDSASCNPIEMDVTYATHPYKWNTGDTTARILAEQSGMYWATSTNGCGTTGDTIEITIHPTPYVGLGANVSACESYVLKPGNKVYQYQWNTSENSTEITVTSSGPYWATLTDSNGCTGTTDTVKVTIHPLPTVDLGNDTFLKKDETIVLDAGSGFQSYNWNDQSTGKTLTVKGAELDSSQLFFVAVVDNNNCQGSDSINIQLLKTDGVNLWEFENFKVYPNPTQGVITVTTTQHLPNCTLTISNALGQQILQQDFVKTTQLDLSSHPKGSYFITITDTQGKVRCKEVVVLK